MASAAKLAQQRLACSHLQEEPRSIANDNAYRQVPCSATRLQMLTNSVAEAICIDRADQAHNFRSVAL